MREVEYFHTNKEHFFNLCDVFAPCAITMNEFKRLIVKRDKNIFDVLSPSDFAFLQWKLMVHLDSWTEAALKKKQKNDAGVSATITADDESSQTSELDHCNGIEDNAPVQQPPAKKKKTNQKKEEKISDFRERYEAMKKFCNEKKDEFGQAYIEHRRKIREEFLANCGGDSNSGSGESGLLEETDKPKVASCLDEQWL
jgi:hypothetical protein